MPHSTLGSATFRSKTKLAMYPIDEAHELHTDYMLAVGDTSDAPDNEQPSARHFDQEVPLTEHVFIGPVEYELREAILDACEPRGENWHPGFRQFGSVYGLLRRNPPKGRTRDECDPDRELARVAAILRLARPHGMAIGAAARVIVQPDGRREIAPARVKGPGALAFVIEPERRWVRDEDVDLARRLLASSNRQLPPRVTWGMAAHELLHWQHHVEVRWLLLCTALEGFVHTDDRGRGSEMQNREQFVVRLTKLASLIGEPDWTEAELDATYGHRNETMHGGDIRRLWVTDEFPPLYKKAERSLRAILRAAILRPEIAQLFDSDSEIRTILGTQSRKP